MLDRPHDPHASQFETSMPRLRIVLLGASNLSMMFPHVVTTLRATSARPLEVLVAKGPGRSYGQESKFFGKKFPGILQCGLWPALRADGATETRAVVADIGNDLAYEAPVERIVAWIETVLMRLEEHQARAVLNNIPLDALRGVGEARYRVLRSMLFPRCTLSRRELMRRAERLSDALDRIAGERKTPVFSGKTEWYGIDPIHPRRAWSGAVWQAMLGALSSSESAVALRRARPREALWLHRLKPAAWTQLRFARRCVQPAARFADGTSIALY
jgi:hypothetical protein